MTFFNETQKNLFWETVQWFSDHRMEVNGGQSCYKHSSKCHLSCSAEENHTGFELMVIKMIQLFTFLGEFVPVINNWLLLHAST